MNNNEIIVLVGKSGAGKDYLASLLHKESDYNLIVSHTTRPKREGEVEGVNYHFIDSKTVHSMIAKDMFYQYRTYDTLVNNKPETWYYGTSKESIKDNKKYVVVLDLEGALNYKKLFPDRAILFYIDYVTELQREFRARDRGSFCQTEWNRRLLTDEKDFKEASKLCDYTMEIHMSDYVALEYFRCYVESYKDIKLRLSL